MDSNAIIWNKVANGDIQAYSELFRLLYKRLYNYGRKFSSDDDIIEDVAQETMLILWQKRSALEKVDFHETYSFTIFRNLLFTRLKHHRRYISGSIVEGDPEFAIDHFIISLESDQLLKKKLEQALANLTSRQREAIFLRFYEGLPYEEVSQMLGITTKATYKIIARALEELRQQLQIPGTLLILLLFYAFDKK